MRQVSWLPWLRFAAMMLLLVLLSPGLSVGSSCHSYQNSAPSWVEGYGPVCAGTGAGCTECVGGAGGGYQVCVSAEAYTCISYRDL